MTTTLIWSGSATDAAARARAIVEREEEDKKEKEKEKGGGGGDGGGFDANALQALLASVQSGALKGAGGGGGREPPVVAFPGRDRERGFGGRGPPRGSTEESEQG